MSELDIWNVMIEDLRGTTQSIAAVCEKHEREDLENDSGFLAELDQQIFLCNSCNWWCEIHEMSEIGDWECTDCVPEEDEDN